MYGTLDMGIGTINHSPTNDPYNSAAGPVQPTSAAMTNSGTSAAPVPAGRLTSFMGNNTIASRWGFTGVEDMGGGMKANFRLESPVNIATGSVPSGKLNDSQPGSGTVNFMNGEGSYTGALFEREATVGLEGGFGSVKLGRQTTINADAVGAYDPMKAGFAVSPLGFNGGYSGGGYTGEARWDNSIKYAYKLNNALTARFGYRTGNYSGIGAAANAYAANVEYSQNNWGAVLSYVADQDALLVTPGASGTTPGIGAKFADTKATLLAFRVQQGNVTYKFGTEHIQLANPANPLTSAQVTSLYGLPVTSVTTNAYATPQVQNMYFLGANWQVSAPLELSAAYYRRNDSAYGTGSAYTLSGSSKADYLSFMANYSLSKRTRLYTSLNLTKVNGPVWSSYNTTSGATFTNPNLQVITAGVVHNF
jgi:predicted porin